MRTINRCHAFALAGVLFTLGTLDAQVPQNNQRFVPNHITLDDVTLFTPNGEPRGVLKKGTLVAAKEMRDVLDVVAKNGNFGFADKRFFSRLSNTIEITEEAKRAGESSNRFAFDLYQRLRQQEGNLFLSPASLSVALAMTYAGSSGITNQEMATVLHFEPEQKPHEGFSAILNLLNSTGGRSGYSISTANRLWGASGYPFDETFVRLTEDKYRAAMQTLDFRQPEKARNRINEWVKSQTREKIVDLIPPGALQPSTRLVLTNAIYFEGGWASVFSPQATQKTAFHPTATETLDTLMMEQQERFPYTEDAEAQVLAMPYRGNELSMVIVLPKKAEGLAAIEEQLTNEQFNKWMGNLTVDRPVITSLPKFKLKSQFKLSGALTSLGMKSAFSDDAELSAMSNTEDLAISEVIHQAFVDVDEKGTEAAAATAVTVAPTNALVQNQNPAPPVTFHADHPFVFMIRENRTGAVLFMGRLQRPDEDL